MIAPARVAALDVLTSVSAGRADLPAALARARAALADERDRALVAEMATGVQRWRAALDHVIEAVSRRRLDRLDPEVVEILRLGIYQILHLARVPAAAVVSDAVNQTKRAGKGSAAGFVNAVLRSVSRQRRSLPLPRRPAEGSDRAAALDYLSITLSHPRWLAARWHDRFGLDTAEAWMRFNNHPAPLTLRANTRRVTVTELAARLAEQGVVTQPGRFAPDALLVDEGHPLRGPGPEAGWFVVQDEASQLVTLLAGPEPGALVLDACASPGGKTTAIAATQREGRVVACDVRGRRMQLLRRTVAATGAGNVYLVQADLKAPPFGRVFDTVIVDAPCSGLGTLRRDPDIRWRRQERDLAPLAESQLRLLRGAAEVVTPGGRLIYATCSSEPEENEDLVAAFLAGAPDFAEMDARTLHPALAPELVDPRGHLRTAPDRHQLEAFFGAVLVRRPGAGSVAA